MPRQKPIFAIILLLVLNSMVLLTLINVNPLKNQSPLINNSRNQPINSSSSDLPPLLIWQTTWGGPYGDYGQAVAVDAAGAVYCVGYTNAYSYLPQLLFPDLALVKYNANGTKVWNTIWGGTKEDYGYGVAVDATGAIYCVGYTSSFGAGGSDLALIKFNANGTIAWNTTWGGPNGDVGYGVAVDATGAIYCVGYTYSFGAGKEDIVLIKYYPNGMKAWNTTWGGSGYESGSKLALDTSGAIYCVGYTKSFGAGGSDLALIKFNANGTIAWNTTWGGSGYESGSELALDTSGAIYCVGYTNSFGAGGDDLVLLKFFSNGTKSWQTTWGGPEDDIGYGVAVNAAGAIYCVGSTSSFGAGGWDFLLVKFHPNSTKAWNITWGYSSFDIGKGLVLDACGAIYCVGYTDSIGAGELNFVLIKFIQPIITLNRPILDPITPNPDSDGLIELNWNDVSGASMYDFYRSTSNITSVDGMVPIARVTQSSYQDRIVDNGMYYYVVMAADFLGNISSISDCEAVTVLISPNPPEESPILLWDIIWGGPMGDIGYGMAADESGAIYCVGSTYSFGAGNEDLVLIKYYPNGTKAWNTTWGGPSDEIGHDMAMDATDAIYCVGVTYSFGAGGGDLALIKFNANGTIAWNTTWGGPERDVGYGVAVDATGAIYCVGLTSSFGAENEDLVLVKFNANGTKVWTTTWGGLKSENGYGVAVDMTGAIYCVGSTSSFGVGGWDLVLFKFNANGTKVWNTTWGGSGSDYGRGMAVDATGAIYCVGSTSSFGAGGSDILLVKFNANGTSAWYTTWGGPKDDNGYEVAVNASGAIYCVGSTSSFGAGGWDLVLVKFNANGTKVWQTSWGGQKGDYGRSMAVDTTGAIYCIGSTSSLGAGGDDFTLIKFYQNNESALRLIHFPNLIYLNCTLLEYYHTGLRIALNVYNGLVENVILCENSTGTFINRTITNSIGSLYWIILSFTGLKGDTLAYYFYAKDTSDNWVMKGNVTDCYILNASQSDYDNDRLTDFAEIFIYRTNPFNSDTDGDGLLDSVEIFHYKTNPNDPDTDSDGISDRDEIALGMNPLDPANPLIGRILLIIELIAAIIVSAVIIKIAKLPEKPLSSSKYSLTSSKKIAS